MDIIRSATTKNDDEIRKMQEALWTVVSFTVIIFDALFYSFCQQTGILG